jgi:hypothetical protein
VPANYIDSTSPNEATSNATEESYYHNDSQEVPETEQPEPENIEYGNYRKFAYCHEISLKKFALEFSYSIVRL